MDTNFNINLDNFNPSTLASSLMLINVSISAWSGRKLDKRVSEEVDQAKSTKARAGNYNKNLFAGTSKLDEITKLSNAARSYVYGVTQPWGDNGDRAFYVHQLTEVQERLEEHKQAFAAKVIEFLNDYDTLVSAAAFQLGDLFNREDYPSRDAVAAKFSFRYTVTPVPLAGDFRVDINNEGMRQLQEQYNEALRERVAGAMQDAWDRLHECLSHMSERLADKDAEGGRKKFHDTLVENAVELTGLLKHFNITGDTRMDEMRRQLEETLRGVDAPMLRDSDEIRRATKRKVDEMLDKFSI